MALNLDELIASKIAEAVDKKIASALGAEETEAAEAAPVVEETSRETYSKSGESGAA